MKVLLDENLSERLRPLLMGHVVATVRYMGLRGLHNGELLQRAADLGFEAILTGDRSMEHQQNRATLPIAIVVVIARTNAIVDLLEKVPAILQALNHLKPRSIVRVE